MRTRLLLRALWQHHRRASLVALLIAASLALAPFAILGSLDTADEEPSACPHLILDRVWFDRYPDDARTELSVWVWLSGGVGAYQQGSAYRASFDIFEFNRSGRELGMTFLQDDERAQTRFTIESCDEAPFDLCLTLEDSVRGPQRYFGFSEQSAYARETPGAATILERARNSSRRAMVR